MIVATEEVDGPTDKETNGVSCIGLNGRSLEDEYRKDQSNRCDGRQYGIIET